MHADIYHLFESTHLPPHYVNLFMPAAATDESRGAQEVHRSHDIGLARQWSVGQTAFVAGTHKMDACAAATLDYDAQGARATQDEEGGEPSSSRPDSEALFSRSRGERLHRLVRPHLEAGDLLIFDCRVLHFGLANRSAKPPSGQPRATGGAGVWRPTLYANVTQRWFEDKKNWDAAHLFTTEDREACRVAARAEDREAPHH